MASSSYSNEIDDIEMSCKGMQFLLNNDLDACQQLFDQYRHYSPLMNGAWSFVSFLVIHWIESGKENTTRKRNLLLF